ncbi:MAG: fused MFS/spermidine synthase [Planctomycetota bacterium]
MAIVLAAVIGGMALGAFWFGPRADRSERPLRLYGRLELGVAGCAFVLPWLMTGTWSIVPLLCPAILMGGTLPAAVAALRSADGRSIGWLYAANTLGAVFGTLLAGFVLIPALGLHGAMLCGVALSGGAGAVAVRIGGERIGREVGDGDPGARRAIFLYAVSGFLGLVAEVAFTRQLVLVFGSSTYAFSTMLAVFLFGIGAGGALGTRFTNRNQLARLEWTVATTAALFSLGALAVYFLPRLYIVGYGALGAGFGAGLVLRFLLAALVLLPGALGLGIAFPLAAHAAGRTGKSTGMLYAANTAASVLGSTLAVFVFIPWLGPTLAVAGVAVVAALACGPRRAILALVATAGLLPPPDVAREHLLSGAFYTPDAYLIDGRLDRRTWNEGVDIWFARHGREATAAIHRWYGRNSVLVDGKAVASNQVLADEHHLSLLGHLPMAIHPDPQRVLVVGLGMGTTYSAVKEHAPEQIAVAEIEAAVAEAAAQLGVKPDELHITDARALLKRTGQSFDVITSDPIHPWVRGGGDLYSLEYFRSVKSRLRPGGVACQWLPVYQMGLQDVRDVVRTFSEVFHTHAYFGGGDLVLVGMVGREPPRPRRIELESLQRIGAADQAELFVAGHERLRAAGGEILRDDNLRLEFSAPRQVTSPELADCLAWIQELWQAPPVPYAAILEAEVARARGQWRDWEDNMKLAREQAPDHGFVKQLTGENHLRWCIDATLRGQFKVAEKALGWAEAYLPDDPRVMGAKAELYERRGEKQKAHRLYKHLLEQTPDSAFLKRKLGQ